MKAKPDAISIRKETKKVVRLAAAANELPLIDYLEAVLDFYFEGIKDGSINEADIIRRAEKIRMRDSEESRHGQLSSSNYPGIRRTKKREV